jgi:energy-converting hydrogenase Eha subunit E
MGPITERERYAMSYSLAGIIVVGSFAAWLLGRAEFGQVVALVSMALGAVGLSLMPGAQPPPRS